MDAAVGERARGDQFPLGQLRQRGHPVAETIGEDQALHLVIVPDAIVTPGGIEHPVADVHQIQQTPELLFREFDFHTRTSRLHTRRAFSMNHSIADPRGKYH